MHQWVINHLHSVDVFDWKEAFVGSSGLVNVCSLDEGSCSKWFLPTRHYVTLSVPLKYLLVHSPFIPVLMSIDNRVCWDKETQSLDGHQHWGTSSEVVSSWQRTILIYSLVLHFSLTWPFQLRPMIESQLRISSLFLCVRLDNIAEQQLHRLPYSCYVCAFDTLFVQCLYLKTQCREKTTDAQVIATSDAFDAFRTTVSYHNETNWWIWIVALWGNSIHWYGQFAVHFFSFLPGPHWNNHWNSRRIWMRSWDEFVAQSILDHCSGRRALGATTKDTVTQQYLSIDSLPSAVRDQLVQQPGSTHEGQSVQM